MRTDFQSWYSEFLQIAKTKYYFPEKSVDSLKALLWEYYVEGLLPLQAAEQELGWD